MKLKSDNAKIELHFRQPLTVENFLSSLKYYIPELDSALREYDQSALEPYDVFEILVLILNPFLENIINTHKSNTSLTKRTFHFLEKMARSHEYQLRNSLGITVLKKLNDKQVKKAQNYMGPSTKNLLLDLEKYYKSLFSK
jgi:hypothetical protein